MLVRCRIGQFADETVRVWLRCIRSGFNGWLRRGLLARPRRSLPFSHQRLRCGTRVIASDSTDGADAPAPAAIGYTAASASVSGDQPVKPYPVDVVLLEPRVAVMVAEAVADADRVPVVADGRAARVVPAGMPDPVIGRPMSDVVIAPDGNVIAVVELVTTDATVRGSVERPGEEAMTDPFGYGRAM
jgi:hypothetical protein